MLGELENKIHEYYNDIGNKELQKEVIYAALKEMAVICVSGLNVYVHNKAYMNNLIGQDLINYDTARHIKELLIDDCNMEDYEKYVFKNVQTWNVSIPNILTAIHPCLQMDVFIIRS